MRYEVEGYGECVDFTEACLILRLRGVLEIEQLHGSLIWIENRKDRRAEPVFLKYVGWLYPVSEIS